MYFSAASGIEIQNKAQSTSRNPAANTVQAFPGERSCAETIVAVHIQNRAVEPFGIVLQLLHRHTNRSPGNAWTVSEMAQPKLSASRGRNQRRVLEQSRPEWLGRVSKGLLSNKHLEAVLTMPQDAAHQLLGDAMAGKWSAARLREQVQVAKGLKVETTRSDDPNIKALENRLGELLGTLVRLQPRPKGGGDLLIRYTDYETLDGVLGRLGYTHDG